VNRRGNNPRRHRTWIEESTGLLKPDESGKERSCHKFGGKDHLSFEIERVTPKVMGEHSGKSAYETRKENWPYTVWRVARKDVST
jgi:hypothetical protein